jgi:hypothetical protein
MNFLSSSRARPRPMSRLIRTTETVRTMVVKIAWRRSGSVRTCDVVFQAGEGGLVRAEAVPVQERDDQRHHERKLGDDDEEDQGRQQRCTPCPGQGAFPRPGVP